MAKYEYTKYERETVINFNEEEKTASVYTLHKPLIRKLKKYAEERDDITIQIDGEEHAQFIVPKTWIKVSPPRTVNYTEEQKQAIAERLKKAKDSSK